MITPYDVVAEARQWMGTRWLHQAHLKGVGVDCIGLIGGVALAVGIPGAQEWASDPTLHNYGRSPNPLVLLGGCDRFMDRVSVAEIQLADVLVMSFEKDPQHFALVSSIYPIHIIHAYAQRRQVVENSVAVFGSKVLRAYRFRGLTPWLR